MQRPEPADGIRISVALLARGREDTLARALRSLRSQSVQPWEVVVSDDSDPATAERIERLAGSFECRYVPGPRQGLYANRNAAALACRGTHVRTMDDDHELPEGHLEACLAAVRSDPEAIWVIGEWIPERHPLALPVPAPGELHPRGFAVPSAPGEPSSAIADGSTIYPRTIFERGVRYPEEFTFGMVYLELGERLTHLGYRIRRLDSTYVLHHSDPATSTSEPEMEESARMYAMLCHSFLYRRSLRNASLTMLELARRLVVGGARSVRALARARRAYRRRRFELRRD
jgi:glycosyltransferase involved in cell wall biosynthesis